MKQQKKCKCHYQCGCDKGQCNCYVLPKTMKNWRTRFRKLYQERPYFGDIESFIEKELERALDLARVQHSRTMAIPTKDHKKELERADREGYGRGYQTALYNQKLLAKKEK
jgi:hypothetical protein